MAERRMRTETADRVGIVLVVAVVVASALACADPDGAARRWVSLVAALALHLTLVLLLRRGARVPTRLVWAGLAVVLVAALWTPPHRSRDVYAYASYGRILVTHHHSPYVDAPENHPDDAVVKAMAAGWREARQVYGPAFALLSVPGALVHGDSPTRARIWYQSVAALALLCCGLLLQRLRRDAGNLAALVLSPVATVVVTHEAHLDILLGALLLATLVLVRRVDRREEVAMLPLAVAVLIKLTVGIVVPALVVWLWVHRGHRVAVRCVAVLGAVVTAAYLPFGVLTALRPTLDASVLQSSMSMWRLFARGGVDPAWCRPVAAVTIGLAALAVAAAFRNDADPALGMVTATVVAVLAAPYGVPWYLAGVLPLLATAVRSRLIIGVHSLAATFAVLYGTGSPLPWEAIDSLRKSVSGRWWPAAQLVVLLVLVARAVRHARRGRVAHPSRRRIA